MKKLGFLVFALALFYINDSIARPAPPRNVRFVPEAYRQLNVNYPAIEDARKLHGFAEGSSVEPVAVFFYSTAAALAQSQSSPLSQENSQAQNLIHQIIDQFENRLNLTNEPTYKTEIISLMDAHGLDYEQALLIFGYQLPRTSQQAELAILEFASAVDKLNAALKSAQP